MRTALFTIGLFLAGAPAGAALQQSSIELRLDPRGVLARGEPVRVFVRTLRDGYLLVLHAEPDGRIRVLFPLDPVDDAYVRGGREYEVRGRGDRDAFRIHTDRGVGTVYAAFSPDPFRTEGFTLNDHWDYRLEDWRVREDAEAALTALAARMAADGAFDYDLVRYDVGVGIATYTGGHYPGGAYASSYGYPPHVFFSPHVGIFFAACGPFLFDPFFCFPPAHRSFFFGFHHGVHHGGFVFGVPRSHDRVARARARAVNGAYRFKNPGGAAGVERVPVRRRPAPEESATTRRRAASSAKVVTAGPARRGGLVPANERPRRAGRSTIRGPETRTRTLPTRRVGRGGWPARGWASSPSRRSGGVRRTTGRFSAPTRNFTPSRGRPAVRFRTPVFSSRTRDVRGRAPAKVIRRRR